MIRHAHMLDYAAYLKGGTWKCDDSPTKAHHWIVGRRETVCKYCLVNNAPKPISPADTILIPPTVATSTTP